MNKNQKILISIFLVILVAAVFLSTNFSSYILSISRPAISTYPTHAPPPKLDIPTSKFVHSIPSAALAVNISVDKLPPELAGLIFGINTNPIVQKVTYVDDNTGYNIKYDLVLTEADLEKFRQEHPELGASASNVKTQDVVGFNSLIFMSSNGWKILANYRSDYSGFIDAENESHQVRFTQKYQDYYTAQIIIESILR